VSRTRCSALRAAPQSRDPQQIERHDGPRISSAPRRKCGALRSIRGTSGAAVARMERSAIRGRRCVSPGFRGACHRARIRATRWLHPGYDVRQRHCEKRLAPHSSTSPASSGKLRAGTDGMQVAPPPGWSARSAECNSCPGGSNEASGEAPCLGDLLGVGRWRCTRMSMRSHLSRSWFRPRPICVCRQGGPSRKPCMAH
jgi:hypothetical protein